MSQFSHAPLPPEREDFFPIARPAPGQTLRLVLLSPHVWGVLTHWREGREVPCMRTRNRCFCQRSVVPARWTGYFSAFFVGRRSRKVILPITENAARSHPPILDQQNSLSGIQIDYSRDRGSSCGKCWLRVVEPRIPASRLPSPFDLSVALEKLWAEYLKKIEETDLRSN